MKYADMILPEFEREMAKTRQVLECVPEDKFQWQATPTSHTIGWNANHLAEIPGWVGGTLTMLAWDVAPADGEAYQSPNFTTRAELLALFDQNVTAACEAIQAVREEDLGVAWSLLHAGNVLFTMPRRDVIRYFVLNHTIHHRAILCTYLRIHEVAVPAMYGV